MIRPAHLALALALAAPEPRPAQPPARQGNELHWLAEGWRGSIPPPKIFKFPVPKVVLPKGKQQGEGVCLMGLYESERIPSRLSDAIAGRFLTRKAAARAIGISRATLYRIMDGGAPDIESYLLVKAWLAGEAAALVARAKALVE
jgi:hypothetical protein